MSFAKLLVAALLACASSACATYTGSGKALTPASLTSEPGWVAVQDVPLVRQTSEYDCGPAALAMVLGYYEHNGAAHTKAAPVEDRRYAASELRERARAAGYSAFVVEGTLEDIQHELSLGRPVIAGMAKPTAKGAVSHYEVIVGLHVPTRRIATLDPALGSRQNSLDGFVHEWVPAGQLLLIVLPPRAAAASPASTAPAPSAGDS